MTLDEAIPCTIAALQSGKASGYGYDLYPTSVVREVVHDQFKNDPNPLNAARFVRQWSPVFFEAAWELCGRGLVRPGVRATDEPAVPDGGYSLTGAGLKLLPNLEIPTSLSFSRDRSPRRSRISAAASATASTRGHRRLSSAETPRRGWPAARWSAPRRSRSCWP